MKARFPVSLKSVWKWDLAVDFRETKNPLKRTISPRKPNRRGTSSRSKSIWKHERNVSASLAATHAMSDFQPGLST